MAKKVITIDNITYMFRRIREIIADATTNKLEVDMSNANVDAINRTVMLAGIQGTAGTGEAYTCYAPGINTLFAGAKVTIVPHVTSTTTTPTLNVNNLGAKPLRQRLSSGTAATTTAGTSTWLSAGFPVDVVYNGTMWVVDIARPSATYLYGQVPIAHGGTAADNAADALTNLGAASATDLHAVQVSVQESVQGIQTTVASLQTTVDGHTTQIKKNTDDIDELRSTNESVSTEIGNIYTFMDSMQSAMTDLEVRIAAIEEIISGGGGAFPEVQ